MKVIDIPESGLSAQQLLESIQSPDGVILRHNGRVIARLQPADDIDLEDEIWARQPEQIERGRRAREEYRKGETISHEQLCAELGIDVQKGKS